MRCVGVLPTACVCGSVFYCTRSLLHGMVSSFGLLPRVLPVAWLSFLVVFPFRIVGKYVFYVFGLPACIHMNDITTWDRSSRSWYTSMCLFPLPVHVRVQAWWSMKVVVRTCLATTLPLYRFLLPAAVYAPFVSVVGVDVVSLSPLFFRFPLCGWHITCASTVYRVLCWFFSG